MMMTMMMMRLESVEANLHKSLCYLSRVGGDAARATHVGMLHKAFVMAAASVVLDRLRIQQNSLRWDQPS